MTAPTRSQTTPVPNVRLVGLFSRRLNFAELDAPEGGVQSWQLGHPVSLGLELEVSVSLSQDRKQSQTTLKSVITPDPHIQPYRIEIELTGVFQGAEGVSEEELTRFAQTAVPVILFPYVREIVHRLTIDARFGPTHLHPVNVTALLGQAEWRGSALEGAERFRAGPE